MKQFDQIKRHIINELDKNEQLNSEIIDESQNVMPNLTPIINFFAKNEFIKSPNNRFYVNVIVTIIMLCLLFFKVITTSLICNLFLLSNLFSSVKFLNNLTSSDSTQSSNSKLLDTWVTYGGVSKLLDTWITYGGVIIFFNFIDILSNLFDFTIVYFLSETLKYLIFYRIFTNNKFSTKINFGLQKIFKTNTTILEYLNGSIIKIIEFVIMSLQQTIKQILDKENKNILSNLMQKIKKN